MKKEKIGTKYIVYLKESEPSFRLLLDEGQCLREISANGDMISNAGKSKWSDLQKEILAVKEAEQITKR